MSLAGQDGATDGYELVQLRPDRTKAPGSAGTAGTGPGGAADGGRDGGAAEPGAGSTALFRRRSAHASRRGVLYLQAARDAPPPPDLAAWFTERGFHFYVASLRWSRGRAGLRRPGGPALTAAFAELDARCEQLRSADGIEQVIVTAHGEGALAAVLWCAAPPAGGQPDAMILYAPGFAQAGRAGRALRRGLDIPCPVLVVGADPVPLGRHVTWLRPSDGEARPDAGEAEDRSRFFDEMGRWLGAYMYGQVRDQLL